jgi:hypothetical protein
MLPAVAVASASRCLTIRLPTAVTIRSGSYMRVDLVAREYDVAGHAPPTGGRAAAGWLGRHRPRPPGEPAVLVQPRDREAGKPGGQQHAKRSFREPLMCADSLGPPHQRDRRSRHRACGRAGDHAEAPIGSRSSSPIRALVVSDVDVRSERAGRERIARGYADPALGTGSRRIHRIWRPGAITTSTPMTLGVYHGASA